MARQLIVVENDSVVGYAVLNEHRIKQIDELLDQLAHPARGNAGSGDLDIRVQDGKLRFARPTPYPISVGFPEQGNGQKPPTLGLKIVNEKIATALDAMLTYLIQWGNGDLHILVLNGKYQAAIPVPDISVEW